NARAGGDLGDAADIAGGDHVGFHALDVGELARLQARGQSRLENVVGAGGAATEVALRNVLHRKARFGQHVFRLADDVLPVLQRAGGVAGDRKTARAVDGRDLEAGEKFAHVL